MSQGVRKRGAGALAIGLLLAALGWGLDGLGGFAPELPIHTVSAALVALGAALVLYAALQGRLGRRKARAGSALLILLTTAAMGLWNPPVLQDVPLAPMPFPSGGQVHLAYEIRLRHYGISPLQVGAVRVLDEQGLERGRFDADFLSRGPFVKSPPQSLRLPAGGELILYMWLALPEGEGTPLRLDHEIIWVGSSAAEEGRSSGPSTPVDTRMRLRVIGPPLQGGPWMARAGPSNWSRHRRARIFGYMAQRFAIDWVRVDEQGRSWTGAQNDNRSYYAYGAEVLAAADGTVVEVIDGIPENQPPEQTVPVSISSFAGNSVVLRLDKGLCAFYAHLQPGSLRVKAGDSVSRGEVLGLVGNSGNSSEPHLHFHLANGCSALRSEGLPYVYESYLSSGYFPYGQDFILPPPQPCRGQLPLQSELVTFGPASSPEQP